MKESMKHAGYRLGDMSPHVEDYQKPHKDYSQEGFSRTDAYIERQDKFQAKESSEIKRQSYQGRYS
jgi:hypothetical protein